MKHIPSRIWIFSGKEGPRERYPLIQKIADYAGDRIVEYVLFGLEPGDLSGDLNQFCISGDLQSLILFRRKGLLLGKKGFNLALKYGHLKILKWMNKYGGWFPTLDEYELNCVEKIDYLPVFQWIDSNSYFANKERLVSLAIRNNQLNILKYLDGQKFPLNMNEIIKFRVWPSDLETLKWVQNRWGDTLLLIDSVNLAAVEGHLDVLQWAADLTPPTYPTPFGVFEAFSKGQIEVVKWMNERGKFSPSGQGISNAISKGHLEILKWLYETYPSYICSCAREVLIKMALAYNRLEILEWFRKESIFGDYTIDLIIECYVDKPLFETPEITNWLESHGFHTEISSSCLFMAADHENYDFLKWGVTQSPEKIDVGIVNKVAGKGRVDILNWLASQGLPLPDFHGANMAVRAGHLNALKWMASREPPILPTVIGINRCENLTILKWAAALKPPILPDISGANIAASNGRLEILNWLAELEPPGPFPDDIGIVLENGELGVLEWMLGRGIIPSTEDINMVALYDRVDVFKLLASHDPPILPHSGGAKIALLQGCSNTLKWMASQDPPILPGEF